MSKAAFSDRKRRDAFPVDRVFRLAIERPDLKIDVNYVLTGYRVSEVPHVAENMAAYESGKAWAIRALISEGLAENDPMRESLAGFDAAMRGNADARKAISGVIRVYAQLRGRAPKPPRTKR